MLSEGMIKIPPKDKEGIKEFIKGLKEVVDGLLKRNPDLTQNFLVGILHDYSNGWYGKIGQKTANRKLRISFIWEKSNKKGWYDSSKNAIVLNLRHSCKVRPKSKDEYRIQSVDYKYLATVFYHELVHYYQDMAVKRDNKGKTVDPKGKQIGVTPGYDKEDSTYFSHPWEQQAWGLQYVEELRQALKDINPADIISHLKSQSFVNSPRLMKVKETNYEAWKKMMKNAIMYVVADLIGVRQPHTKSA